MIFSLRTHTSRLPFQTAVVFVIIVDCSTLFISILKVKELLSGMRYATLRLIIAHLPFAPRNGFEPFFCQVLYALFPVGGVTFEAGGLVASHDGMPSSYMLLLGLSDVFYFVL